VTGQQTLTLEHSSLIAANEKPELSEHRESTQRPWDFGSEWLGPIFR
jgi:hypothetical protein